ncbi:hypothetical protein PI125_g21216 [Phytophthora idaei]|nr:hypothetical protein PI125_g21216 [Phytophthora idaei]KAG3132528.1 hypothetical protein PI126_g19596 [Phytophthora idaei]
MAKVDNTRNDFLHHAEDLAHFAQAWELEPVRHRNLGKEVIATVGERRSETRRCHECNQIEHLWAAWPVLGRGRERGPDMMLAVGKKVTEAADMWILDSGSSRHFVGNESWLDEVEFCNDVCLQPNGDPLNVPKKDMLTRRVTACTNPKLVKLKDMYYATGVVHNFISYGKLDEKGYTLTYRAAKDGENAAFDVGLWHRAGGEPSERRVRCCTEGNFGRIPQDDGPPHLQ